MFDHYTLGQNHQESLRTLPWPKSRVKEVRSLHLNAKSDGTQAGVTAPLSLLFSDMTRKPPFARENETTIASDFLVVYFAVTSGR